MRERSIKAYLLLGAVAVLALALAAVAAAGPSVSQIHVTLTDGKVVVSPQTFTAGPVTLLVVNKGKESHAVAIFGAGKLKRTPTLKPDATTKLTLDTSSGTYKVWDPVRSSLSHALVVTAKPAASSTSSGSVGSSGGSVVGGSTGGSLSNGGTKTCLPGQNSDMYDASNASCPPGSTGAGATTTTTGN
jgi:plastocyanin